MKVAAHSKQIGGIFFAADSDGDSDDDNTEIRLKANKSRVGRIFSRNRETHDRLTRSLHDAELCFTTAGSSLHALGVTKVGERLVNRVPEIDRHIEAEATRRKELKEAGDKILGFHRDYREGRPGMGGQWEELRGDGEEDDEEGSVEDAPKSAPSPGSYADLQRRIRDLEQQKQGMRSMIENLRTDQSEREEAAESAAKQQLALAQRLADQQAQMAEMKQNAERMQEQLIGFLDKQDDPHGNTEAARVPEVTSQVAQSICALYEYIRKNSLRLRDIFHGMDRNQNGILDLDEFTGAMQSLNLGFSQLACESIFRTADEDGNGAINYQEFLQSFRAGVDAFGKEQGVMYTFHDMRQAKESLAKKKDLVIQKYRIKWEHAEDRVKKLQRDLKELRERKARRARRKRGGEPPPTHVRTASGTSYDTFDSEPLVDDDGVDDKPNSEGAQPTMKVRVHSGTTSRQRNSDSSSSSGRNTGGASNSSTAIGVGRRASARKPRTANRRASTRQILKPAVYDAVGPRDILSSAESKEAQRARWEQQQRRNDEDELLEHELREVEAKEATAAAEAAAAKQGHDKSTESRLTAEEQLKLKQAEHLQKLLLEARAEKQPGHPGQRPKLRAIVHIAELQLKQQRILALRRNGRDSAGKLADKPAVPVAQKSETPAPPVVARATARFAAAGRRVSAALAKNHLAMLARQSAELREKDSLITKLYRDLDSAKMAANAAEHRSVEAVKEKEEALAKVEKQVKQIADLHKELQTTMEEHATELAVSDNAVQQLNVALDVAYNEVADREELIQQLEFRNHRRSPTASSPNYAGSSPPGRLRHGESVGNFAHAVGSKASSGRQAQAERATTPSDPVVKISKQEAKGEKMDCFKPSDADAQSAALPPHNGQLGNIEARAAESFSTTTQMGNATVMQVHTPSGADPRPGSASPSRSSRGIRSADAAKRPGSSGRPRSPLPAARASPPRGTGGLDMSTVDNEDLFRLVHRMLIDIERLWRSSSRLLAGDMQGGISDNSGGRGQIRVHMSRLSAQAATVKKAIEQRVPDMLNELSVTGGGASGSLPSELNAPWRWRDKSRFEHANKKWLRPGFGHR